ncbi:MAG TPA: ATP-binding cassette domain-containing protein [Spirochaetota bacterium]|nr:ATP-binding cassette domain-containing protein [Spirochaetota bacterium]
MSDFLIEFDNVNLRSKDKKTYLQNLSFKLSGAKKTFIVGEREKERTLFLKSILGIEPSESGSLKVCGMEIKYLLKKELYKIRRKISFMPAQEGLIKNITIGDNLELPLNFNYDLSYEESLKRIKEISKVFELDSFFNKKPWGLEPFLEKKITFARALTNRPLILLINEPTSYIEKKDINEIKKIIDSELTYRLCSKNPLILITTEDREWAKETGDIILHFRNNTLYWMGNAKDFENI